MNDEQDKSVDELWAQANDAQEEPSALAEETIPDDDSDLLGEDADESDVDAETQQFNPEAYRPLIEYLQKEILPSREENILREAQNRARQSQKARDEQIKAQLSPLVDQFKRLEEQGLFSREDSQREYAAAYQRVASETEQRERAQQEAELRQRWLAAQNTATQSPAPTERPIWQVSTETRMNQMLEQSGLTDQDPELANVPLKITHDDPNEALDYFKVKVESAVKEKQQRLQTGAKPKPFIDMGTGGGAGAVNPLAGIEDNDQLWDMAMKTIRS